MQTFLPYPNFYQSANVLDKKRCWKQTVEAKQIIQALTDKDSKSARYINHPAVKMWVGHEELLKHYFNVFLLVCLNKHKIKTTLPYYDCQFSRFDGEKSVFELIPDFDFINNPEFAPWWLGNCVFHKAQRARLLEKDFEFYSKCFTITSDHKFNDGKYLWPVMETKTFRII